MPVCRYRHLLLDLAQLLPHSKKDSKLDTKSDRGVLNEVADMKARSTSGGYAMLVQLASNTLCTHSFTLASHANANR